MPIADLLTLVEKLQSRIDRHGSKFRQSEALTRYALVDPLLRALGWDTEDPTVVIPEYSTGGGRADYALLTDAESHPAVMVEAKKLDTPLQEAISQGIKSCLEQGVRYFVVTDGRNWKIYETHRPVPLEQKMVVSFALNEPLAAEVCRKALALWRAGVKSGKVSSAYPTVVDRDRNGKPTSVVPLELPVPPEGAWTALSDLRPSKKKRNTQPIEVMFPNGERTPIKAWRSMLVEVVRWLVDHSLLNEDKCPIGTPQSDRYAVAASPMHGTGTKFTSPEKVGALHVERTGGAATVTERAKTIVTSVGQDLSQFMVRFPG